MPVEEVARWAGPYELVAATRAVAARYARAVP
jgi:hypothetical protein